jgi:hypothetical protein
VPDERRGSGCSSPEVATPPLRVLETWTSVVQAGGTRSIRTAGGTQRGWDAPRGLRWPRRLISAELHDATIDGSHIWVLFVVRSANPCQIQPRRGRIAKK